MTALADDAIPTAEREWVAGSDAPRRRSSAGRRCASPAACWRTASSVRFATDRHSRRRCAEYERIEREDVAAMRLDERAATSDKVRGQELESALSVRNLALLGRILATAALRRTESRGAHFRLGSSADRRRALARGHPLRIGPGRQPSNSIRTRSRPPRRELDGAQPLCLADRSSRSCVSSTIGALALAGPIA